MGKISRILIGAVLVLIMGVLSLQSLAGSEPVPQNLTVSTLMAVQGESVEKQSMDIDQMPFQDNMDLYQYDDPGSVVTMYATIRRGNPSDNSDHTWREVNDFTKFFFDNMRHVEVGKAEVILQAGDENGPIPGELGYGEVVPNGTIQVRGASSSRGVQKSYKIELFNRTNPWRGQRTIALNKHIYDHTRTTNKLCFDLMKDIPNMVSLRTQFVHLYVKDETANPPSQVFEDYGLFTQIEQPNGRFLENHLLDRNGQLYKPTFFEFYRYPEEIRLADDPLYDEDAFFSILEVKGNKDHSKLIQMLEDVNNYAIPIEETFEKYFNSDNFFTWKAFNILVGNIDTQSQNFYLYSPQYGQKWYFIPWDYDGTLDRQHRETYSRTPYLYWEMGIANEWVSVLNQRLFKLEKYRQRLTEKIEELMAFLTPQRLENMLAVYRTVTEPYITRMPDRLNMYASPEEIDYMYRTIPSEIQLNYDLYLESLKMPMPFYLGTPQVKNDELFFIWDEAYDFDGQDIYYHFQLSRDVEFNDVIETRFTTNMTSVSVPRPETGAYFWRVTATNEDNKTQYPFDVYRDAEGQRHGGMKYFYITADRQVLEARPDQ